MEIIPSNSTLPQSEANQAAQTLAGDFDQFLSLLTTQLQFQDPLDPLDSNQFTEQLVSFTGVEQQIAQNQNLEAIISQLQSQNLSNAVGYLGKEITVETDRAGLEDGIAKWEYSLETNSAQTRLLVKNRDGEVIHSQTGETAAGLHNFTWQAPADAEDEVYILEVQATAGDENRVRSTIFSKGIVNSIESLGGETLLALNGILTPPSNVLAINNVPVPQAQQDEQ